jgi:sulfhydrogenase subunit gamma (sulfur reductase)
MKNEYAPRMHKIKKIIQETPNVKSYVISKPFKKFTPGQFIQVTIPGSGEITLGITSPPKASTLKITVNKVGNVTKKLHELKTGDLIGIRGPYGNGWPKIENKKIIMIAGGVGIVPLKPVIHELNGKLELYYGARTMDDLLFYDELKRIVEKSVFTVDKRTNNWKGRVGVVTDICEKLDTNSVVFVCGPPVMMKFVVKTLKDQGFKDEQIYLSLERLMQCGIGLCEHCRVGKKLVCQDGPVFRYDDVKEFYEVET